MTTIATSDASAIFRQFEAKTPGSARMATAARAVFPSGITHDSRHQLPYPLCVARAAGSRKWDVDGNEYVDYSGGHGALLLGHCHPAIVEAVQRQVETGTHFGACHELEIRWGQAIQRLMPSAERVRFTSSGTEATLLAIRLARGFTGKSKIVRLAGHFHGWHDHVAFGVQSHFDGAPTPGVLDDVARQVLIVPPGDVEALRATLEQHADIAAVILEPTGASWGQVPLASDYLHEARRLTSENGVLLIFDEVISGFRCGPGGAQGVFSIRPDLTTLAKIVAGGLPGGALVGRADVMQQLEFGTNKAKNTTKISHHGTFNANPLSAAAGIATLEIVEKTDACARANQFAARLRAALSDVVVRADLPWKVYGSFSGFHIFLNPKEVDLAAAEIEAGRVGYQVLKTKPTGDLADQLRVGMLLGGVEIFSWPGGPTSAVHTDDDLNRTADAFDATIRKLKTSGAQFT